MHAAEGVSVAVNNAVGSFVAEQSGVTNSIVGAVVVGASVVGGTVSTTGTTSSLGVSAIPKQRVGELPNSTM